MTAELDKLYREYHDICEDRGVFPKSRNSLKRSDEADWLTYVIALIAALPSREERKVTLEEDDAPDDAEPFRKSGDI